MHNLILDGSFQQIAAWFFLYSFIGWIWESAYRSIRLRRLVNSGFLLGPYIPIYGFGALLYILLLHFTLRPIELFFLGAIIASILEYFTSWLLEKIFHARWWDYSSVFANLNGRICLISSLAFGLFAVILPQAHLFIGNFVTSISSPWLTIVTIFFAIIMLTDTITTCRDLIKFNHVLSRYQKAIDRHKTNLLNFVRKGQKSFEMRLPKDEHQPRQVLTFTQRRTIRNFPAFDSIKYPEALKRIEKLYASINQKFKDSRYKPTPPKSHKKTGANKHQ